MKKILLSVVVISIAFSVFAQVPQFFKYQAVARDNAGALLSNQNVSFQISILQGSSSGTSVYVETHTTTTGEFGLANLEIGNGDVVSGIFADIDWAGNTYFLQIEMDEAGGNNYLLMGTSQLLSVPYALYSSATGDTTRWRKSNNGVYYADGDVSIGAVDSEESALLDLSSNSQGFLPPRLNTTEIENIANPAEGLIVFNTDYKNLNIFDGTAWNSLSFGGYILLPFYVSPTGNNINAGTQTEPFLTVSHAIEQAQIHDRPSVKIAAGDYYETISLVSSINLYGGFNSSTWERDPETYQTKIWGGTKAVTGDNVSNVSIDGLHIQSDNAISSGQSSYGLFLTNSTGINFTNNTVISGSGQSGNNGNNGSQGTTGSNGLTGQPGCENGGYSCDNCDQPLGGYGGNNSASYPGGQGGHAGLGSSNGQPGQNGYGPGGDGGDGGDLDNTESCTGFYIQNYNANGDDGDIGDPGSHGEGGVSFGIMNLSGYSAANGNNGTNGTSGGGGGGGGGGKGGDFFCDSYGSSGGGGGAGGAGGNKGYGGNGGGGSFGIWAYNSSLTVKFCSISTNSGGPGGTGGSGGTGGLGGSGGAGGPYGGGNEQDDGGCGGWGGNGGEGGQGGNGGGGGGGPSIGIITNTTDVVASDNVYNTGSAGSGGSGTNSGENGVADNFYIPE